ncbi:MAG: 4-hydroxythreonine-4-phosphate dehydrogenase PdxA [Pseudomonadota bacterium]
MAPRVVISTGEPAGIGPDIALSAAREKWPATLAAVGDTDVLAERARALDLPVSLRRIERMDDARPHRAGHLDVLHQPMSSPVTAGQLNTRNARDVLAVLDRCTELCREGMADAMVTAPLHKAVINDAGIPFTGHTEYLAERTGAARPVMLLCAQDLRVALATTHLPLSAVPAAITEPTVAKTLEILRRDLVRWFGIADPTIGVCGLNPHAGEGGHLGHEDDAVIAPVLDRARAAGHKVLGPLPADTAFNPRILKQVDAILAMYHDQGLPVLKYAGFGAAINVTLGLPILRTSVDHGTALDLAGTGKAYDGSLKAALELAIQTATATAAPGNAS